MDPTGRAEQGGLMELADLYRRTVETWTARVEAVPAGAWGAPTPCTEWTVRDLVNHVVGEDAWTVPLMRGSTMAEVGDSLDGDLLGAEPGAVAGRSADEAVAVVAETLPASPTVHLSYGDEDAGEYVRQLAADHLVHAWDLAAATGGDTHLDEDLVADVATWFAEREDTYRSVGAVGPRVDAGGSPQADLLAAAGRDVAWTPPPR
jgi:uncharacterized protein (TIGR03086 family)